MWQPNDLLPDSSGSDEQFYDEVRDLRARCADLPDALLVVLIGDMITEEALPTYMAQLNTLDGIRDETGGSGSACHSWGAPEGGGGGGEGRGGGGGGRRGRVGRGRGRRRRIGTGIC